MIRRWISNFIRNNKSKFRNLGTKLIMVAIIVLIATIILSLSNNSNKNKDEDDKEIYKPTETVIKGSDVSEQQYERDVNTIDKFFQYCNNKQVEEAYSLLSDECKEIQYTTLDIFKTTYYNPIFSQKREYNLQSWISTKEYTVYKIRYTTNMLTTGIYEENNTFLDYITLIKNSDIEKISIGSFITSEDLDIITTTNEIEARVIKKYIYLDNEEYIIQVKNKTENTILLDTLNTSNHSVLVGDNEVKYRLDINELFRSNLTIQPQITKTIKLNFKKEVNSNNKSKYIHFTNIIRNYEEYNMNSESYNDIFEMKIKI